MKYTVTALLLAVILAVVAAGPTPGEPLSPLLDSRDLVSLASGSSRVSGRAYGWGSLARVRPRSFPGEGGSGAVRPTPSRRGKEKTRVRGGRLARLGAVSYLFLSQHHC